MKELFAKSIITLSCIVALAAIQCSAENSGFSTLTPPPSKKPAQREQKPLLSSREALEFALDIAESQYEGNKTSMRALSDFISAQEKLIELDCMGTLSTLTYTGKPKDPKCTERITKIFETDPDNPVGICARDGIDSESCKAAYATQETALLYTTVYEDQQKPGSKIPPKTTDLDVDLKLAESTAEGQAEGLEVKLSEVERVTDSERTFDSKKEIRRIFTQLVGIQCKIVRLRLMTAEERKAARVSTVYPSGSLSPDVITDKKPKDELTEYVNKYIEKTAGSPTPTPDELSIARYLRLRLISDRCRASIERAFRAAPDLAAAICARVGNTSPDCIQARKKERDKYGALAPQGGAQAGNTEASQKMVEF